jgi:hypothetical protein
MPGPSNTLLIEGSFSELAEELAQYLDNVNKADTNSGLQNEIASSLAEIREQEQAEEPVEAASTQKKKDDVLKKVVGRASVLNTAPEKGLHIHIKAEGEGEEIHADHVLRVHRGLQPSHIPLKSVTGAGHVPRPNMLIPLRSTHYIFRPVWPFSLLDDFDDHLQHSSP